MRPFLRAFLLSLRAPYFLSSSGYLIDLLPHRALLWLFSETPSERLERRLHMLFR